MAPFFCIPNKIDNFLLHSMIQGKTQTDLDVYLQVLDNKIGDNPQNMIAYLFKFTNDMSGDIVYVYPLKAEVFNRYGLFQFSYNIVPDIFTGLIDINPSGYYKYEVFQVDWSDSLPVFALGFAPETEFDILTPPSSQKGVVMGLVTKGKMLISDVTATQQVKYNQHPSPSGTNYIWSGQ